MRADTLTPRDLARRHAERRDASTASSFRRETFVLPRDQARVAARRLFERFPRAAYMTEIEYWEELEDGRIRFTMRRLPVAD